MDHAVKPAPVLQLINLVAGAILIAWEWPLAAIAGSPIHRSIGARLAMLPLAALPAGLMYQGTNACIYYVISMIIYAWAYRSGEVGSL